MRGRGVKAAGALDGGVGGSLAGATASAVSSSSDSAGLRLHERVEELKGLDELYGAHVLQYEERMVRLREGEARYAERRAQTVAYLRRFQSFIAETDAKRLRAEKKEAEERRGKEEKEAELVRLHRQLRRLTRQRNAVQRRTSVYRQYRAYLEGVLLHSEAYSDIDELMTRHAILSSTHADLTQHSHTTNTTLEHTQQRCIQRIKHRQNVHTTHRTAPHHFTLIACTSMPSPTHLPPLLCGVSLCCCRRVIMRCCWCGWRVCATPTPLRMHR